MIRTIIIVLSVLFTAPLWAQEKEYKPEDTEVWEPVPKIVTPGEGNNPPSDAIVLFDGTNLDEWMVEMEGKWVIEDGVVTIHELPEGENKPYNLKSKRKFGSMQLHIEWRAPDVVEGEGQGRGNSGVFIQERYEVQVQDNYDNPTYVNGQAGAIYKQSPPLVNACKKPGEWQTYDIFYTAPEFDEIGIVSKPAYITVVHNGVLIQNHTEIKGTIQYIGLPCYEPHGPASIVLQDHGNPVSFRNIWVRSL